MEIIQSIEEVFEVQGKEPWEKMDGFKVTTDKQEILVLINNSQGCCEQWGHLSSNDELQDFAGAELLKLELVDEALDKKMLEKFEYGFDGGGIVFVNFETNRGTFQLAVYNNHNGYYGHSIMIKSEQLNLDSGL